MMSPPSILQSDLLNTQKQDKGEMEPDSCQSIETGSKNGSLLPDPRHPTKPFHAFMFFSVLTYHALMGYFYHTKTRIRLEKVEERQKKTWKEYHKLYKAVGLQSDFSPHKMRNMFTHYPKNKSYLKKSYLKQ